MWLWAHLGISQVIVQVKRVIYSMIECICRTVVLDKRKVVLNKFGSFNPRIVKGGKKVFGHEILEHTTIKFKPFIPYAFPEESMEKLGVVIDDEKVKTGSKGMTCPSCGTSLLSKSKCDSCGTEPFEKKPEQQPKK
jgi:hypothetical protein